MRRIQLADITILCSDNFFQEKVSFRLKVKLARLLDSLGVSTIEVPGLFEDESNYYLVKAIASAVSKATVSVPVNILDSAADARSREALKEAPGACLRVPCPVSTVQMEYFCHKKPEAMLRLISERISQCRDLCEEVEFVAGDFTRAEKDFLHQAVTAAVESGASIISLSDAAGDMLPDEFGKLVADIKASIPENVKLGVICSDKLFLADACAIEAVRNGADIIKTSAYGSFTASLAHFPHILGIKSVTCGAYCGIDMPRLDSTVSEIHSVCKSVHASSPTSLGDSSNCPDIKLTIHDDMDSVMKVVEKLGYELDEEDSRKVYDAFVQLASTNEFVDAKELDATIASVAFQVPATWKLESFVINSGNIITATCHIRLIKDENIQESVCLGDGPVDAAFLAIEKVIGTHYELDDFQIRALTEGREAMGETVVRLRSGGKIYSGRGVSTDIVGSSIMAYIHAVNKIVYEEGKA